MSRNDRGSMASAAQAVESWLEAQPKVKNKTSAVERLMNLVVGVAIKSCLPQVMSGGGE